MSETRMSPLFTGINRFEVYSNNTDANPLVSAKFMNMKISEPRSISVYLFFLALLFVSGCVTLNAFAGVEENIEKPRAWQMDPRFERGLVEYAVYDGIINVGDSYKNVSMEIVTGIVNLWPDTMSEVADGFEPDAPEESIEAVKTSIIRHIPGENARRKQIVTYAARNSMSLLRFIVTVNDINSTVYKNWSLPLGRMRIFSDYLPSGEGVFVLTHSERMILLDDLPNRIRGLAGIADGQWEVSLLKSVMNAESAPPVTVPAAVTLKGREEIKTGAGTFSVRRITVRRRDRGGDILEDVFYFNSVSPHRLIEWRQANGDTYSLSSVKSFDFSGKEKEDAFIDDKGGDAEETAIKEAEDSAPEEGKTRGRYPYFQKRGRYPYFLKKNRGDVPVFENDVPVFSWCNVPVFFGGDVPVFSERGR